MLTPTDYIVKGYDAQYAGAEYWDSKVPSKESIALYAFLSPPKRFQNMEILHVTSGIGSDRSKIIKSIQRYFITFSIFSHSHNFKSEFQISSRTY
jgi:hypothetical protein